MWGCNIDSEVWNLTKSSSTCDQKALYEWFNITMEEEKRLMHLPAHWSSFLLIDTFTSEVQLNTLLELFVTLANLSETVAPEAHYD